MQTGKPRFPPRHQNGFTKRSSVLVSRSPGRRPARISRRFPATLHPAARLSADNAVEQPLAYEPPAPVTYLPLTNRFTFRPTTNVVRPAVGTVNFQSSHAQPETTDSAYENGNLSDSPPAAAGAPLGTVASYVS